LNPGSHLLGFGQGYLKVQGPNCNVSNNQEFKPLV